MRSVDTTRPVVAPSAAAARPSYAVSPALAWILAFLLFEIACQLALMRDEFQPVRKYLRAAGFGVDLALLFLVPGTIRMTVFSRLVLVNLAVLSFGLIHPYTGTFAIGIASVLWYLSVFAASFWVTRLRIDIGTLRILMAAFWLFHALSSAVGVLQTYFPGRFQGAISALIEASPTNLAGLTIQLDDGQTIYRPMGLTDSPGGAAISGLYACLIGLPLVLDRRFVSWRWLIVGGMVAGAYCLLLSQVRVFVLTLVICATVYVAVLMWRGQRSRAAAIMIVLGAVALAGTLWAASIGREAVVTRLITLVDDDPIQVYQRNRGFFLQYTLQYLIWDFPFGAGLGRWGMIAVYFSSLGGAEPLYAEINWTAWCYDGGVPLMIAMATLMIVAVYQAFRMSEDSARPEWCIWTTMLVAYNVGFIATTFVGNPLLSQIGVEYVLINAVVTTAWVQRGWPPAVRRVG